MSIVPTEPPARERVRPKNKVIPADIAAILYPRILRSTVKDPETGCIVRTARINPVTGYSHISLMVDRRAVYYYAHRVVWTHLRGAIPDDYTVDHLCGRQTCVNIDHLRVVTQRVNILASNGAGAVNARRTHCREGHPLVQISKGRRGCIECRRATQKKLSSRGVTQ